MTARAAVLAWLSLGLLLALTVALACVPMGAGNLVASLAIATVKRASSWLVFMKLWGGRPLNQLAAGVLVVWLAVLIGLTFADYLTRPEIGESEETNLPAPEARSAKAVADRRSAVGSPLDGGGKHVRVDLS